tara:strand:+ start:1436 stop:1594 length:159 start_codon:yes stop_codon:yes gene_type:complete
VNYEILNHFYADFQGLFKLKKPLKSGLKNQIFQKLEACAAVTNVGNSYFIML